MNSTCEAVNKPKSKPARWIIHGIALAIGSAAILHSLVAPMLLMEGIFYLMAVLVLLVAERKLDRLCLALGTAFPGVLLAVYFVPLWIAGWTTRTPEDHFILAEKFALRGQLLGNPAEALAHYRMAAEGGNVEAQSRLGHALFFGHYGPVNRAEGLAWLRTAAAHGHPGAENSLRSSEAELATPPAGGR